MHKVMYVLKYGLERVSKVKFFMVVTGRVIYRYRDLALEVILTLQ